MGGRASLLSRYSLWARFTGTSWSIVQNVEALGQITANASNHISPNSKRLLANDLIHRHALLSQNSSHHAEKTNPLLPLIPRLSQTAASLMILCIFEPGIFCAVYVMPFWVHGIFWVRGATEFDLLTIYNYCLLLAGIAGTYDAARLRVVTPVIPIICLALSSVNIFTYCWSYQGYYCPAPILPFERTVELTIGLVVWFFLLVIGCTYLGRKHRRRDSDLDLDFINSSSLTEIISHRRTKSSRLSNVYDYAKSWAMTKWRQSVRFLRHNSVHGSEASRNANGHVGDAVVNMPTTWKATVSPDDTGRNGFFVNNDSRKYL
ncbi:hypothetical protein SeMB42_g07822 [Synchytrium endobioticum]|uniref:Transmembrane protein n=1 Tax=Synchytrium endobioticum TaxID=286115 RepID=A0A507BVV9_9FUNG|nr:hypothetical protein SeMB42_g07822 [Synchytrium endobioticum]